MISILSSPSVLIVFIIARKVISFCYHICDIHDFMGILVRMFHKVVFYCQLSINLLIPVSELRENADQALCGIPKGDEHTCVQKYTDNQKDLHWHL